MSGTPHEHPRTRNLVKGIQRSVAALKNPDAAIRRQAAADLAEALGPSDGPLVPPAVIAELVVPALVAALKDPEEPVCESAAVALGVIHPAEVVVPALFGAVNEPDDMVLALVDEATKMRGPEAIPVLIDTLKSSHRLIHGMRPASAKSPPDGAVLDAKRQLHEAFIDDLVRLGRSDPNIASVLVDLMEDGNGNPLRHVVEALGRMLGNGPIISPALTKALFSSDMDIRRAAIEAIGKRRESSEAGLRELVACLGDTDYRVRKEAADSLGRIGGDAIPLLSAALSDPNPLVREGASGVFLSLTGPAEVLTPALLEALRSDYVPVRRTAAVTLAAVDGPAEPRARALVRALDDPSEEIRQVCERALRSMRRGAVPVLAEAATHPTEQVRAAVIRVLAHAAPETLAAADTELEPDVRVYSEEDQRILAWFDRAPTAEYIEHLQVFWCIGIIDRDAMQSAGPAIGYARLTELLERLNPRSNLVPLSTSVGHIREKCLPNVSGFFDREPFYSQAWSAEESDPDLRIEHKKGRPHGRWTPRARKVWTYVDRFLTLRGLLPQTTILESQG